MIVLCDLLRKCRLNTIVCHVRPSPVSLFKNRNSNFGCVLALCAQNKMSGSHAITVGALHNYFANNCVPSHGLSSDSVTRGGGSALAVERFPVRPMQP